MFIKYDNIRFIIYVFVMWFGCIGLRGCGCCVCVWGVGGGGGWLLVWPKWNDRSYFDKSQVQSMNIFILNDFSLPKIGESE